MRFQKNKKKKEKTKHNSSLTQSDAAQNRRHACGLGHLVQSGQAEVCVYVYGAWIPGGLGQRTPSG